MTGQYPQTNQQLRTRWTDGSKSSLVTELVDKPVRKLRKGEILVEVLYVPLHGSFWLATHPDCIHPRYEEFLSEGSFAFGNGGIGRVIATESAHSGARIGDYVSIFGHIPCNRHDCYACTVLHRYTECDYQESTIIGHGNGAHDGTYAKYCILPPYSYELCLRAEEHVREEDLIPFMFAFLIADVRNALTRQPDTLRNKRMLLFGAGQSGHIAAYIHLRTCPEAKILVVDPSEERLASIRRLNPDAVETYLLSSDLVQLLNSKRNHRELRDEISDVIDAIANATQQHFDGRNCNLLFDSSSGNSALLWDNTRILSAGVHCITFGFGSENILLNKELIQLSGLNLLASRGVGNLSNRRAVIEWIKTDASNFINEYLKRDATRLKSLEEAIAFINEQHKSRRLSHQEPHAFITPVALQESTQAIKNGD